MGCNVCKFNNEKFIENEFKYAYKPYKLPKIKNNIILTNSKQNYSYYCSTSGVNKNANK